MKSIDPARPGPGVGKGGDFVLKAGVGSGPFRVMKTGGRFRQRSVSFAGKGSGWLEEAQIFGSPGMGGFIGRGIGNDAQTSPDGSLRNEPCENGCGSLFFWGALEEMRFFQGTGIPEISRDTPVDSVG